MPENPIKDVGLEGKLHSKAGLERSSAVQGHGLLRLVRAPGGGAGRRETGGGENGQSCKLREGLLVAREREVGGVGCW